MTRVSWFNNTNTLFLHFPSSTGADYIEIAYIGIKGEASKYKPPKSFIAIYESRPMAEDHKAPDKSLNHQQIR